MKPCSRVQPHRYPRFDASSLAWTRDDHAVAVDEFEPLADRHQPDPAAWNSVLRIEPDPAIDNLQTNSAAMAEYRELQSLGVGGFGEVFACVRAGDGAPFALKPLNGDQEEGIVARFRREVQLLSSLEHPNVVEVVDTRLDADPLGPRRADLHVPVNRFGVSSVRRSSPSSSIPSFCRS